MKIREQIADCADLSSGMVPSPAGYSRKKSVLSSYDKSAPLPLAAVNVELQYKYQHLFDVLNESLLRPFLRDKKGYRINPAPQVLKLSKRRNNS